MRYRSGEGTFAIDLPTLKRGTGAFGESGMGDESTEWGNPGFVENTGRSMQHTVSRKVEIPGATCTAEAGLRGVSWEGGAW